MKIAYITTIQLPSRKANSIQVMKMSQALSQLGHDVTLIIPGIKDNKKFVCNNSGIFEPYGVRQSFKIICLEDAENHLAFTFRAIMQAKRNKSDLVFSRSVPPSVLALIFGLPTIMEIHQMPSGKFGPLWFKLFLKLKGIKRMVPITYSLFHQLNQVYKMSKNPVDYIVAASGVDLDKFSNIIDNELAKDKLGLKQIPTVMVNGHLYQGRGMRLFLDLAEKIPSMQFVWVGGMDDDVEKWKNTANQRNLKNVVFWGFKLNAEIPLHLASANILLIPYDRNISGSGGDDITDFSSPMKLFEYMAARRPIISSDLPVLHEVLNERNCIFCDPENLEHWVTAIKLLNEDSSFAEKLATQAWSDVQPYSWYHRAESIFDGFKLE